MTDHPHDAPDPAGHAPHVVPARVLVGAAAALLALTAVTVASSRVDLGRLNVALVLAIAGVKASVVALFFMHLKYDSRFKAAVLVGAVLFVAMFAGAAVFDTTQVRLPSGH
ncbi:MAG TPA: cytochrome C oxidase subunit IV family protein [Solirubrobacter sp.]